MSKILNAPLDAPLSFPSVLGTSAAAHAQGKASTPATSGLQMGFDSIQVVYRAGLPRFYSPLGTCAEIDKEILRLKLLESTVAKDPHAAGLEIYDRYSKERESLVRSIGDLNKDHKDLANKWHLDQAFLGASLILSLIGVAYAAPIATVVGGAVFGAKLLLGPSKMVMQALVNVDATAGGLLIGYGTSKTVLIGEAVTDQAKSASGKLFNHTFNAASHILNIRGLYDLRQNQIDRSLIQSKILLARIELEHVSRILNEWGSNADQWGELYLTGIAAVVTNLEAYRNRTSANDCSILQPSGPSIARP